VRSCDKQLFNGADVDAFTNPSIAGLVRHAAIFIAIRKLRINHAI